MSLYSRESDCNAPKHERAKCRACRECYCDRIVRPLPASPMASCMIVELARLDKEIRELTGIDDLDAKEDKEIMQGNIA